VHTVAAETAEALGQCTYRHTLDRIEVDRGTAWDGVLADIEHDLARKPANDRRARSYQGASKARDSHFS